jgi:cell division protein FtsL
VKHAEAPVSGESFEYAVRKDVRNNPIVREVDRERHRRMWRWAALALFFVPVLVFSVWRHAQLREYGYDVGALQDRIAIARKEQEHLALEVETLRSRARIERLAMQRLGMIEPGPEDQEVIERVTSSPPPPRTVVARR